MISLILATKGHKKDDIKRFLNSIKSTNQSLFEVIIVCQDEKGYLDEILINFRLDIKIFYSSPGLSKARNVGIRHSKGDILAFPDDDCVYTKNLIKNIESFFQFNSQIDIISFNVFDLSNSYQLSFVKIKETRELLMKDIAAGVSSISLFHRNKNKIYFDEEFGVGAKYNSSEEFDYVLRLMLTGSKLLFSNKFRVLHPDSSGTKAKGIYKRTSLNGIGHGAYYRKNYQYLRFNYVFEHLVLRPFIGFLYYSISLKKRKAKCSLLLLQSRLRGFFLYKTANKYD